MGTIHPVLFNCTECGNIICKEEELEVCTYCGAFSKHFRSTRGAVMDESLRKAIENKVFVFFVQPIESLVAIRPRKRRQITGVRRPAGLLRLE